MLSENLVMLRNLKGLTQEQVAEVVEISRQSYANGSRGRRFQILKNVTDLHLSTELSWML